VKIKLAELIGRGTAYDFLSPEVKVNLDVLLYRLNFERRLYQRPMVITNAHRSLEHHEKIYEAKNAERMRKGLKPLSIPMGSCHLLGAAVDISDPHGFLKEHVLKHRSRLEAQGNYFEHFEATPGYVHWQIYPPLSGEFFFWP
jgi:hypothetical protein